MGCCNPKSHQNDFNETIYKDDDINADFNLARHTSPFLSINSSVSQLYLYNQNESKIKNETMSIINNEENIESNDDNLKIVIKNINENITRIKNSLNKIELKQKIMNKKNNFNNISKEGELSIIDNTEYDQKENIPKTKLTMIIISSKIQKVNTEISITPYGMIDSLRNSNDNSYIFGVSSKLNDTTNDYNFLPEQGIKNKHFIIKYKCPNYYLKNFTGAGTFVLINKSTRLLDKSIIVFSNNFILVGISEVLNNSQIEKTSKIKLKVINGLNKGDEL